MLIESGRMALIISGSFVGLKCKILHFFSSQNTGEPLALVLVQQRKIRLPIAALQPIAPEPILLPQRVMGTYESSSNGVVSSNMSSASGKFFKTKQKISEGTGKMRICNGCGGEYDEGERIGKAGKITECNDCATEDTERYVGRMIFSHKTAPVIEVKQADKLVYEAKDLYRRRE